jgi:hypothetical protein
VIRQALFAADDAVTDRGVGSVPWLDFGTLGSDLADSPDGEEYAALSVDADAAIAGISHWLIERCDHLTERIVRECVSTDSDRRSVAFAIHKVRSVTLLSTKWILQSVGYNAPGPCIDAQSELEDCVRICAQQRISLDVVLRIFQIQHSHLWRQYVFGLERLLSNQTALSASRSAVSRKLFEWSDRLTEAASRAYIDELTNREANAEVRRWQEVRLILDQSACQPMPSRGSLDWPMDSSHVGMTAWEIAIRGACELGEYVERLERAISAPMIALRDDSGAIRMWLNTRRSVDRGMLTAVTPPHNIALAIGEPANGLEGFRRTHQQAQLTKLLVERLPEQLPVVRPQLWLYREHQLGALALGGVANIQYFISEQIGALADYNDASEQLCETVDVFFASGMNKIKTAEKLSIHRNTLCYRLDRAAALRGRPLLEQQIEMAVALRLRRRSYGSRLRRDAASARL